MKELLFFCVCNEPYEHFIPIFTYFVHRTQPSAALEFHTVNDDKFQYLTELYDVEIHHIDEHPRKNFATFRWLLEPHRKFPYTYIGDVDILVIQDVLALHRNLVTPEYPISNIVRDYDAINPSRLSGLQFVISEPYFTRTKAIRDELSQLDSTFQTNDECTLYQIVKESFGIEGILQVNPERRRPVCGIHCSLRRDPYGLPGWGLSNKASTGNRITSTLALLEEYVFKRLEEKFDPKLQTLVEFLRGLKT